MADSIIEVAEDFWNIRGTFRMLALNIGTQSSLVRLKSGRFVLLDSYSLEGDIAEKVLARTNGGEALEAIINLHPFHTVHVKSVAAMFPDAKLYGTSRHHSRYPQLAWQPELTESPEIAELYNDDFEFLVPRGVDFVPDDEKLHFASVLALHRSSHALHVDDTLNWVPLPLGGRLDFHPTLKAVLQPGAASAAEFRTWAEELAEACADVQTVCTAHVKMAKVSGGVDDAVRAALKRVEKVLRAHERKG